MPLLDPLLNTGADAITAAAPLLTLHSGDPGTTGANLTSNEHVSITWPPASSGDTTAAGLEFTGPPNGPVTHVGLWATEGGDFLGGEALSSGSDTTFNAAGQYVITGLTLSGSSA